jgi:hypothetical protein
VDVDRLLDCLAYSHWRGTFGRRASGADLNCSRGEAELSETISLDTIKKLARRVHAGQVDPDGMPHYAHCERVANAVETWEEKAVALLHDAIEDSDETAQSLRAKGVPALIVEGVEILTRRARESYMHYVARVADALGEGADLARVIKVADASDNLSRSRTPALAERAQKYEQVLAYLTQRHEKCPFCGSEMLIHEVHGDEGWRNFGGWLICPRCRKKWTDPMYWQTLPGQRSTRPLD